LYLLEECIDSVYHCVIFFRLTANGLRLGEGGGFIVQKFNRRTALEPTTKLSNDALNPPYAKPLLWAG
jgi:hypothetical protein